MDPSAPTILCVRFTSTTSILFSISLYLNRNEKGTKINKKRVGLEHIFKIRAKSGQFFCSITNIAGTIQFIMSSLNGPKIKNHGSDFKTDVTRLYVVLVKAVEPPT